MNDFDNSINDPAIINDLKNKGIDYKLYEILDKNDEDHLLKLFNFIDIIGKLETNNKKLQEQNDLITIKLKQDVNKKLTIKKYYARIKLYYIFRQYILKKNIPKNLQDCKGK